MVSRFDVNDNSAPEQSRLQQSLFEFINIRENQLVNTVLHDRQCK